MKVKCIDNKDAEHYLELNKIYDIDDTPETDYYFGVTKGIGKDSYTEYFRSTRFEVVKEPPVVSSRIKSTLRTWPFYFIDTVHTTIINGIEYNSWYDIPLSVRNTIPTEKYMVVYDWLIYNVLPVEEGDKK